jgi:hypothetical protein
MEVKVETKREYVIVLTKEETEILCDVLETAPNKSKTAKMSDKTRKRNNFIDCLFDRVCDIVETDFENGE